MTTLKDVPKQYQKYVTDAADELGIPANLIAAQIQLESSFDPKARSDAGAEGIAQFEPGTFAEYGPKGGSPWNVGDSFKAYVNYMKTLLHQEGGSIYKALEAYNAGPGNLSAGSTYAHMIMMRSGVGADTKAGKSGENASQAEGGVASTVERISKGVLESIPGLGEIFKAGQEIADTAAAIIGVFGPIAQVFQDFGQALETAMTAIVWLVNPMNWLRILAGVVGVGSVITGAVLVATAA